jgi:hypothetical protein
MARPGLEPGTPRFSVLRPNFFNWAKSPAIKRLLVGSLQEAQVSYLRTFPLQLGTQIGFGTQSTPMAATSPVNAKRRVRHDGGVAAASCGAPVKHDVGGPSERRARRTCARVGNGIRRKGGALRRLASAPAARPLRAPGAPRRRRPLPGRGGSGLGRQGYRCGRRATVLADPQLAIAMRYPGVQACRLRAFGTGSAAGAALDARTRSRSHRR